MRAKITTGAAALGKDSLELCYLVLQLCGLPSDGLTFSYQTRRLFPQTRNKSIALFRELDEVDEGGEKDVRAVRIRVGKVFGIEVLYSSGGR